MRRVYKIKIGGVWLTEGAIETGRQCLLEIINLSKLRELYKNTAIEAVGGSFVTQTFETKDVPFAVNIALLPSDVGELLINLYNNSSASGALLPFTATDGGSINLSFNCRIVSFDYKDSQSDVWENAILQLIKKGS